MAISRDQALLLSGTVYVCSIALVILGAIYFQEPLILLAGLFTFGPDLLPAVGRWLNPTSSPPPQQPPIIIRNQNAPRSPSRITIEASQAQPVQVSTSLASSAAGTVFYIIVVIACVTLLVINTIDFVTAGDHLGKDAIKALASTITGIVGIISAFVGLVAKTKTLAAAAQPSTTTNKR